jgi:hemerythrin-like metal-binding protein
MDVNMPEMDGYEATQAIRSLKPVQARNIPIIAMTANVFREDIEKCLSVGMDDHIGKPIEPDTLYEKLDEYLSSSLKSLNIGELREGIAWSDELETGVRQLDRQHYQMFELLSGLVTACKDGTNAAKLEETADFLVNYMEKHFSDEEALQIQYNYPEYKEHKLMHEALRYIIGGFAKKLKEYGSTEELAGEINKVVVKWLVDHIRQEDKKISEYIRKVKQADLI